LEGWGIRRTRAFQLALLVLTPILLTAVSPVQAGIESRSWIGCTYRGTDAFYGVPYTIYAYQNGSMAILVVSVENDYGRPINVSAVKVGFDWGLNYTSTQCSWDNPIVMQRNEVYSFTVGFAVPDTAVASNQYLHGYKIYVEHVNSTTEPKEIVATMTRSYTEEPDFAVYSADQAEAQDLSQLLTRLRTTAPSFTSARAKLLVYKAGNETTTGDACYRRGDFAEAKFHYNVALSMYSSAYSSEETFGVTHEDLEINATKTELRVDEAQIDYFEAWATMISSVSTVLTLAGLAAVLFAVGYIIKQLGTLRKPTGE